MPEWDDLVARAKAERDAREEERKTQEAEQRAAAEDLKMRRNKAEADYVRTVEVFQRELNSDDYRGVRLKRKKKPLIGSQFKETHLLFIVGAASEWWAVGEGRGPRSTFPRNLVLGPGIKPGIVPGESISYEFYQSLATTPEPIHGLKATFNNHANFGQSPEVLPKLLLQALAEWAAERRPNLKLRMDE
jgi:hypothetical protein